MKLGKKIRELRKGQKHTQETFADMLGITPQYLSRIERDKAEPSVTLLNKVARRTGRQLVIIFLEEDN